MATWIKQAGDLTGESLTDLEKVVLFKIIDKTTRVYEDDDSDIGTPEVEVVTDMSAILFKMIDGSKKEWPYLVQHAGGKEVQSITEATPAENDVYALTFGGATVTTAALGATPDTAALVAAIQAATGYGDLPFLVTAGSSAITLTWKLNGNIATLATMVKTVGSGTPASSVTTEGINEDTWATAFVAVTAIIAAASATSIAGA